MEEAFEDNIKHSFKRVKEHISYLENELNAVKELSFKQNSQLEFVLIALKDLLKEIELLKVKDDKKGVSSGNGGVYSFIHSLNRHSFTRPAATPGSTLESASSARKRLLDLFSRLPKQELLTFLTIFQIEEDSKQAVSYFEISSKLNLSEGCIRTYVSSLFKKNLPLKKIKINNRAILLSIPQEFREFNLKNELISLYYNQDPQQTHLQ